MAANDPSEHQYTIEDIQNTLKRPASDSFSIWYIVLLIIILAFMMSGGLASISKYAKPETETADSTQIPYYGTGQSAPN